MNENRASATARLIAKSMVFLSGDETLKNLVPPLAWEMSRWFVEESDLLTDRWFLKRIDRKQFRSLLWRLERVLLPGITHVLQMAAFYLFYRGGKLLEPLRFS